MARRPKRPNQHSITCADEDWDVIRAKAGERGMNVSPYLVHRALTTDLDRDPDAGDDPTPLALTPREQQRLLAGVLRIAGAAEEERAGPIGFRQQVRILYEATRERMVREGRGKEFTAAVGRVLRERDRGGA